MFWPFLTTVKFKDENGGVIRLEYAVSAMDRNHARSELKRRFLDQEVFGYEVEGDGRHKPGSYGAQVARTLRHAAG